MMIFWREAETLLLHEVYNAMYIYTRLNIRYSMAFSNHGGVQIVAKNFPRRGVQYELYIFAYVHLHLGLLLKRVYLTCATFTLEKNMHVSRAL